VRGRELMRALFFVYLAVIVSGIVYFTVLGALHQ
jgi:hypothetical protein